MTLLNLTSPLLSKASASKTTLPTGRYCFRYSRPASPAGACFSRLPHRQSTAHRQRRSVRHRSTMLTGFAHCFWFASAEVCSLGFGRRNLLSSCSSPTRRRIGGMERGASALLSAMAKTILHFSGIYMRLQHINTRGD